MAAKVLVLGSTGFVGKVVTNQLLSAGHAVRVLVRDAAAAAPFGARGAAVQVGDALNPADLAGASAGADVIVSLVHSRRNHPRPYVEVNADSPRLLGETAKANRVKGVVMVSAIGGRLDAHYTYLTSRYMGEDQLRKTGVATIVLRFSVVLGPDCQVLKDFERISQRGFIVVPGSGGARLQPILVDDAARCVVAAVDRPDLVGQSLDLGAAEVLSYNQLFDIFYKARGLVKPIVHVPVGLLSPAATLMELLMDNPPFTPDELRTVQLERLADGLDSVTTHFGFRPASPSAWAAQNWRAPATVPA